MTPRRNLIIGTAGHIDHGKTVLVKALTGRDTDRLAEEKERGISIDLGFAPLELSDGSVVGIVDVPGHENFVRNMMAGASGVDLALLVVAADDGVMPQTREHMAILDLLGVSRAMVAITKTDLVEQGLVDLVRDEVVEMLAGTALEGSKIIPVSGTTGEGIGELRKALEEETKNITLKDRDLPPRLPIDRVFTLKGIGTVVTGTLWSGSIKVADTLELLPQGETVRVRSLQVHDTDRDFVYAGERVAANLAGVSRKKLSRGDVLTVPGYIRPTFMLDATLSILDAAPRALRRGARIRFHHGTRELLGRVYPLQSDSIRPGQDRCPVQLRLEAAAVCAAGDRFVVRSYSPVTTIGGGVVVDAHPPKHKRHDEEAVAEFEKLATHEPEKSISVHLSRSREPLRVEQLVILTGLSAGRVLDSLNGLSSKGLVRKLGTEGPGVYVSEGRYQENLERLESALSDFHEAKPLAEGMGKETLKRKVLPDWNGQAAELMLDASLGDGRLESDGKVMRLTGASVSVDDEQEKTLDSILSMIEKSPLSPPTLSELAKRLKQDKGSVSDLLQVAVNRGELVKVSPELYFLPQTISEVEGRLREALREGGITVSRFKNLLATTRKYALPLLEYFDRNKVTRRVGDLRELR